ncbi:MAG: HAMP domain-containing protein [Synergistaceae bacterium]|jgi:two-component system sensor histidine kinase CpxA|nr:HAMP domain-containing protein [Synergistaceae bacterium]
MIRFPLFLKIYLTLLFVLFLPVILFTLSRMVRERDRIMPEGMFRHLEWSASELANQSESVPDARVISWIGEVKRTSGLDINVRRDGADFYLPGFEWLASYASYASSDMPAGPRHPIVVSSLSSSGRSGIIAAFFPFPGERGDGPMRENTAVLLSVAVLCVVFSFMLVRNFMNPLSELRRITLKLANGDLSVRVGAEVTGRSDEIADLGASFNWMAECVGNLISSQKRLLSDISHEIRSPMQRMEVALEMLRRKSKIEDETYLDRMELEIYRIDNMVEELLTLTRADGMTLAGSEHVELDEIINSIIEDIEFETGIEKKNISANVQKLSVQGDATLLNRALNNVIHNAIRYAPPETGIEIDVRREGERAAVIVRDHGQGVPDGEIGKIFLPYYRTDKARERTQGGVGLGLAITKRIIENHGGEIIAANAPTGGLVVTIYLKLAK